MMPEVDEFGKLILGIPAVCIIPKRPGVFIDLSSLKSMRLNL